MARQRGGRGARGSRGGGRGQGGGSRSDGPKKRGPRRGGKGRPDANKSPAASYYMQPGKGGTVVILHRAVGNRVSPKVCGVMPTRDHANALVDQLRRAESALHDLFYEATDDGIEALEAVLAACRDAVFKRSSVEEGAMTLEEMAQERDRIQAELDSRGTRAAS